LAHALDIAGRPKTLQEMTIILARVQVRKTKRNEFLQIMQEVTLKTKKEYGCEQFEIHQDLKDDTIFSFYGVWETERDFIKHLKSDVFSLTLLAFKLVTKNPDIHHFKNQERTGLHTLIHLREVNRKQLQKENIK
tara:strand:+ start:378 stop:782 length:405 start_codon:yes stop_codon:yes gene_type:complete